MGSYLDYINKKKKKEEEAFSSSTSVGGNFGRYALGKSIGLDTLDSDLQSVGSTLGNIYGDWQTQETMANTRASVESMHKRLTDYQTYQSKYGSGELSDLSDVLGGYQSALDDWDKLSSVYGYYENADAYRTARKQAEMDSAFGGLTYDEVQERLKQYSPDSDEYKYLSAYTGYSDLNEFDKAIEALKKADTTSTTSELNPQLPKFDAKGTTQLPAQGQVAENDLMQSRLEGFANIGKEGGMTQTPKVANGSAIEYTGKTSEASEYLKALETRRNQWEQDHAFDRFSHILEAEDFAELSQYVSTKSDKWHSGLTSQYGLGYDDVVYEYINDVDGARSKIKEGASTFGRDTGDGVSSMEKKGYDKLTEEEKGVYNYLYQKEGKEKAEEFLAYMESNLEKRVEDETTQYWEEFADRGAFQSAVASAISVPANIYGAFYSTVDSVGDALQGKEYSPYGYYKMPSNISSDIRGYVGENIAEATEGMELFGQNIPEFLYQTGMSVADSAVGATMFGKGSSLIMGASAYQQRAKELKEAGASDEEIIRGAGASGLFEMAFEKLSIDNLFKIKNADSVFKAIKETAKQAGIEGSEEFFTEVANVVFDNLSRGKEADTYKKYEEYIARGFSAEEAERKVKQELNAQIGWSFVGGALSGTAMGGVKSFTQKHSLAETGKQIRANDRTSEMWEMSAMTPQEAEIYKLYEGYAEKGINADNISNAQLGNLYATAREEASGTLADKKSTNVQKKNAVTTLKELNVVSTVKQSKVSDSGKALDIKGVKTVDGETVIVTSEGEVSASDVTLSLKDAELVSYAQDMDEVKANAFISQYDGKADINEYAQSFELAYTYGEALMDESAVFEHKGVLTEAQALEAYKAGVKGRNSAETMELQKALDEINKKYSEKTFVKGVFDDSVIDYTNSTKDGSKVNWRSLTKTQRNAITFVKAFSEATGVNVQFIQSKVENGERVGENGHYNPQTNTIAIDVYAGINNVASINDSIIPTVSHEVTHWMKNKSPEMYAKMRDFILETLTMDGKNTVNDLIAQRKAIMKENHEGMEVSDEDAIDELVARGSEDMLANSNEVRKLLSRMSEKEQNSFIAKVKETFQNLMDWVNELLGKYKSTSNEAKVLRGYENRLKELSEMWDQALAEAIQTNQSLQAEGITGEKAGVQHDDRNVIREGMTDEERYNILKDKSISLIARVDAKKMEQAEEKYKISSAHTLKESERKKLFKKLGEEFNVFKGYTNSDVELSFVFSRGNMSESEKKQEGNYDLFAKMFSCFDDVIESAVGIEVHNRNSEGYKPDVTLKAVYVLVSAFEDGGNIVPVKLEIKEFVDKNNTLYVAIALESIKKDEVVKEGDTKNGVTQASRSSIISLSDLFANINPSDERFLKYVPKQFFEHMQYSDRDSQGRELSEGQQKYFANSKVRDAEGNLKLMYHGTANDFTVFDPFLQGGKNGIAEGYGLYFADTSEVSDAYGGKLMKGYLNIVHPATSYEKTIKKSDLIKLIKATSEAEAKQAVDDGAYDDLQEALRDSWISNYVYTYGMPLSEAYRQVADSILSLNHNDMHIVQEIMLGTGVSDYKSAYKFYDILRSTLGIDGFITEWESKELSNGRAQIAIAFDSNQFKNEDNLNPTEHEDVRYSDRDSDGTQLSEGQQEYFKDSKMRDKDGNLKVMYHGTERAGFTVFDTARSDDGLSLFFVDNSAVAKGYSGTYDEFIPDRKLTVDEMTDLLGNSYYYVEENEGKYQIIQNRYGEAVVQHTADSYEAMMEEIRENWSSVGSGNYKVYLNITNPLVVEADGRGWDELPLMQTKNIDRYNYIYVTNGVGGKYNVEWEDMLSKYGDAETAEMTIDEIGNKFGDYVAEGVRKGRRDFESVAVDKRTKGLVPRDTRQYAYYAKQNGYDGVIFNEIEDNAIYASGNEKYIVSTVAIAFDSNQVKSVANTNPTEDADIRYSDRENVTIYDVKGETESLKKQNALLQADIEALKERLKLERQVTHGNTFNAKQLKAVAKHLKNLAKSDYSEDTLVEELREVYSYIVENPQLDWEVLMAKSYDVARNVLENSKGYKVTNNYFKEVLADIRKARISLSEEQIQEAKSAYGEKYRNAFMGRIMLVKEGTSLDQQWQEWAEMYPEIFDASITGADQIIALSDIYDSLREGAEMYQTFNDTESIRAFATEIYNQYWNVSTIRTTADKYEKQIKRINYEHRKAMGELREDYKKRVEEQKKDAIHYGKVINRLKKQRERSVKKARQLGKKRMDEYKDRLERNAKIRKITDKALTLNKWLVTNSKDAHIPEVMKAPVTYLLNAIDFSSKQLLGLYGGDRKFTETKKDISFSKALEQVHDMVQGINSAQIGEAEMTEIYGTFADFPAGFADDIRKLSSKVNDVMRTVGDNAYVLNQMTLEQLETLDKIVTIIKSTATKMNKFLAIRHAEGVANLSQQSMGYMNSLGKAKVREGMRGKVNELLDWGNALPFYTFKRFGEGGQKVYEALQNGWDTFAFHVKEIIDYAESVYTSKEVKEWSEKILEFDILEPTTEEAKASKDYEPTYQKVQMSVPQIMSLYCLQKREQAKGHLMGGGMRIADIQSKKGVISQTEGVILTQSEIDKIIKSLTDRQRKVADALQKFMNTVCTDWGNEVSMLRFGFKGFGEENYFPIQADKNNLAVNDETEQNNRLFRLLNMSFTKGVVDKANNRIVISDIFDVFAQHSSDMAKYNAMALPVLDAFKWYNYKEKVPKGEEAFTTKSLKQSMENAFGKDAQNYFVTFLRDINGEQSAGRDSVGGGFFTNAKIASVGFNMRVIALQPTSYVRASAVIDPKYLTKAFTHKPKMKMAEKHCGIALWKSLGFYDINVQKGVTDIIKHDQTAKDKIVEFSMKGAEIADKVTWGYLWNACELEVRDKHRNLKVGSEDFYEAVGKRLREVIYSTQVVDSTMTRSHMMRSKDGKDKMLTAFMSEPTLAYNMLQDAYMEWKLTERQTGSKQTAFKRHGKKMARVMTAYTVTNMICALVEAGFDVFRDDDEITPEEFVKLYLKNLASDMSILNKIPYAKEAVSMLQGYSSSRTDTQWMQYMTYTITGVGKLLAGKGNAYTTLKNAIRGFSQMTGYAFYNLWRDMTALIDKFTEKELEEMFNDTIGDIFPSLKSK